MKAYECKPCSMFYVDEDDIFCCMELGCPIRDLKSCPNKPKETRHPKEKKAPKEPISAAV